MHLAARARQRVPLASPLVLHVVRLAPLGFGLLWTPQLRQLFLLGVRQELPLVVRSTDRGIAGFQLILLVARRFHGPTDGSSLEFAGTDLVARSGVLLADDHRLAILDIHRLAAHRRVLVLIT